MKVSRVEFLQEAMYQKLLNSVDVSRSYAKINGSGEFTRPDSLIDFGAMKVFYLLTLYLLIMRPSSLGGGRILRRTLSVRLSVRPSRYRCHR